MMKKTVRGFKKLRSFCFKYKKNLIIAGSLSLVFLMVVLIGCGYLINSYRKYVLLPDENKYASVGLVLGAGITGDGKPFKELQARLDVAAQSFNTGHVDKLILSGDNRFKNYDEPKAMKDYLVYTWHIPTSKLQADYAGRSTYESCERAAKIFSVKEVIIFSAGSHLPRAIFLCRHFGIQAYGISSRVEANNSSRREVLARVKAVYNVYVHGEGTVLGPDIEF